MPPHAPLIQPRPRAHPLLSSFLALAAGLHLPDTRAADSSSAPASIPAQLSAPLPASGALLPATDRPWQLQSFSDAAGLSSQRIFDLCFDAQGDLWLASSGGLYHYDGYTWRTFGQAAGLPSNFIRCVLIDRNGSLWVGSDRGAGIFDPINGTYSPKGDELSMESRSVRHIDQDPDGTLWFSCDRWPDTSVAPGALIQLNENRWTLFDSKDGLPMNYVIGHHRDSKGRHHAFTAQGWVQLEGTRWTTPAATGSRQQERVLHMAEDKNGSLFAQGEGALLREREGAWEKLSYKTAVLHRTTAGELIAIERDDACGTFWFSIWDGSTFKQASAPMPLPAGAFIYGLKEAPDHSVWCVGSGIVTRWIRKVGPWLAHPELPPPIKRDSAGRVWFHGGGELFCLDKDVLHRSGTSFAKILGFDADGAVLVQKDGLAYPITFPPRTSELPPSGPCPLSTVTHSCNDNRDRLWLLGKNSSGHLALARREANTWKTISASPTTGGFIFSLRADGPDGIALSLVKQNTTDYDILRADDSGISLVPIPLPHPPLNYPTFLKAAGSSWIQGYAGVYQTTSTTTPSWERVPGSPTHGFNSLIGNEHELITVFRGTNDTNSGALSFNGKAWRRYPGEFTLAYFGESSGRLYLRSRNGIHIRTTAQADSLEYIPLPGALPPHALVEDTGSSLWVSSPDGVLRYRPGAEAPETMIVSPVKEVTEGTPLPLSFQGLRRWQAHSTTDAFQFSWRIDEAPWGPFQHRQGPLLELGKLAAGTHRIAVRARDAEGNIDKTPAHFDFTISPLPLQSRPWFPWATGGVVVLVIGLAWLGISRGLKLARGNAKLRKEIELRLKIEKALEEARDQLELRVNERTADLLLTNEELKHEIHERHELQKLRNKLEDELVQSQKMQAIGTLAGGIAHDFNNILAIITPCTRMALEECIANPEARENLQQVLAASERARCLVQQILTFSRKQHTNKVPLDLGAALEEALKLMRSALGSGVRLNVSIERDLALILADATQIHQVVINLCTNAQQSLPHGRGTISIVLKDGGTPVTGPDDLSIIPPTPQLTLLISDDGVGMEPELIERIFDPFFTTKPPGKGTGLGLSVVDGIVKSHGGHISVSSTPGRGSTFEVSFPIYIPPTKIEADLDKQIAHTIILPRADTVAEAPTILPVGDTALFTGTPARAEPNSPTHILLVDDEPSVSRPLRIILERAGFVVTVHACPVEAHKAFINAPESFDLLLTDHTMTGMTGPDLAARLQEQRPGLPVILVTGYGGAWTPGDAARIGIQKILTKPVDPSELIAEVRSAVGRSGV